MLPVNVAHAVGAVGADKNRRIIAKEGGIDIILDCLRNGGTVPSLLLVACWAIRNVAVHGTVFGVALYRKPDNDCICFALARADANKKLIQQKGGVELLVRTMERFPNDAGINEQVLIFVSRFFFFLFVVLFFHSFI